MRVYILDLRVLLQISGIAIITTPRLVFQSLNTAHEIFTMAMMMDVVNGNVVCVQRWYAHINGSKIDGFLDFVFVTFWMKWFRQAYVRIQQVQLRYIRAFHEKLWKHQIGNNQTAMLLSAFLLHKNIKFNSYTLLFGHRFWSKHRLNEYQMYYSVVLLLDKFYYFPLLHSNIEIEIQILILVYCHNKQNIH